MAKEIKFSNEEINYLRIFLWEHEHKHVEEKDFGVFLAIQEKLEETWDEVR